MISALLENIAQNVPPRWALTSFVPALVFWFGGPALVFWSSGWPWAQHPPEWTCWLMQPLNWSNTPERLAWAVPAVILVAFSAFLMERFQSPILRLVEGYWPSWCDGLLDRLIQRWVTKIENKRNTWQELLGDTSPDKERRRNKLDAELELLPPPKYAMPTLLGNILRAAEVYPLLRYGLDSIVCWLRLYPLLNEGLRADLGSTRSDLDEMARLMGWGSLFIVWTIWTPWALMGLLVVWLAHRGAIRAAKVYGSLVRAAFDLHRFDLYTSLHWELPNTPDSEEKEGNRLTEYLFRGSSPPDIKFHHP